MNKRLNLIGETFGRLLVIECAGVDKHNSSLWKCRCECGKVKIISASDLRQGKTQSCGCLSKEKSTKHGLCRSRIYKTYSSMKQRCYNQNEPSYRNHGARGIKVCDEWLGENGFINFYNWSMENGYTDDLTLDRINNNGNYEPSNCRWATMKTQQNNKRNNHYLTINGVTKTVSQWAEFSGIKRATIQNRIEKGWKEDELLSPLIRNRK